MGIQFCSSITTLPTQTSKMKFLGALCLAASAVALEDTADVKAAKASFQAAFAAAEAGEHAALAPAQVASAYLDDSADVAAAKASFSAAYAAAPGAPVASAYLEDSADVAAAKAAFTAVYNNIEAYHNAKPFYAGYYGGFYPHAYGAYPYAYGAYPYAAY